MDKNPLVSIIIPTFNAEKYLEKTLGGIKRQTYKNIEVLVIDQGSLDKTKTVARKYGSRFLLDLNGERAAHVNLGVRKAKGKYCYRVDDDFVLEPEIVSQCVEKCENENLDAIAVHNTSAEGLGFWAEVRKLERNCYRDDDLNIAVRFFTKKAFEKVGGFDTDLFGPEDYDFHNRFLAAGFKYGRVKAIERHLGEPKSLKDIFKKSFIYGQEMARYFRKHPQRAREQLNPVRSAFFRHFKDFLSQPILSLGFLIMWLTKFTAGGLGFLKAYLAGFKRGYKVIKKNYA